MQKTLGGDRLGSGKKQKIELHGYERSTHDLGYIWRSTMAAGTLVPFMSEIGLPGDTFDINLGCDVKTHPTVGPLFGSYKVQLDIFMCPIRLYQGQLHNNKLGIGLKMAEIRLPIMELYPVNFDITLGQVKDIDNSQVHPSCLLSYLGIRGVGINNVATYLDRKRAFNAIPFLSYWDIYKNYYANKQEEIGAVIHTQPDTINNTVSQLQATAYFAATPNNIPLQGSASPDTAAPVQLGGYYDVAYTGLVPNPKHIILNLNDGRRLSLAALADGTPTSIAPSSYRIKHNFNLYGSIVVTSYQMIQPWEMPFIEPKVVTFPLENIDKMREDILTATQVTTPFVLDDVQSPTPYQWVLGRTTGQVHTLLNQEGLALKTYQSDLFNNWLQTEWIDGVGGINEITAIDTSAGNFKIDTLILAKKVYNMLNRIAVSGGTYDDWLDAVWTHERFTRVETPVYMGGLIKELVFQEVVSNSASNSSDANTQPLGTLAGKGVMASKHKGGTVVVKVDEPCYIMGIISLTPRLDYSQGNKWDVHLLTMDDLHKPALDEIGFQELITEQMAWWSTYMSTSGEYKSRSAGKQPAWINYMTNVNQVRGNFAIQSNEMFMTLNRRYEINNPTGDIKDLTTYIDPKKFNHIFAQTSLDAQNFWTQVSVDITARRKMSAKVMPNL